MIKYITLAMIALICFATAGFAAGSVGKSTGIAPTEAAVTALAQKYLTTIEPKLAFEDKLFVDELRTTVFMSKGLKSTFDEAIGDMVSHLTLKLAACKSAPALTAGSAYLVTIAPKSPRTNNLFAAVLHATGKFDESIPVLDYTLSLSPKSTLAMVNLANACLDANQDAKAKKVLDSALALDKDNRSIYRALATYYWKKKDMYNFKNCLVKAAKFAGIARKKVKPKLEKIKEDQVEAGDSLETMKQKTEALEESIPLSSADLIEEDCPDVAQKIRDKYGKLIDSEKMIMPNFPQVNLNSNQDFAKNHPIVEAWVGVFASRAEDFAKQTMKAQGIDPNASEAVMRAQAKKAAQKQMSASMRDAEKMLKAMQNMPGMTAAQQKKMREAMTKLKNAAGKNQVKLEGDSGDENDPSSDPNLTYFFDSGSPLAGANYAAYVTISNSHELYISKLLKDYRGKEMDIARVYSTKIQTENKFHDSNVEKLKAAKADSIAFLREELRHKQAVNSIGDGFYKQWINIYVPYYVQKFKPAMDGYWRASTLYIKNMTNPDVMKREYGRVLGFYSTNMMMIAGSAGTGGHFIYLGPTDAEEEELRQAIKAAEEEAKQKVKEYERNFQPPTTDWKQWCIDHFVVEVKIGVLALKVTARTIEFDAWLGGVAAGFKASPIDGKLDTYTAIGGKLPPIGVNVCGIGGKIEGKGDIFRKTAHFDFDNGTYSESYSTAKAEVKGQLGPITGSVKVDLDAEFNAHVSGKYSVTLAKYDSGD